VQITDDNRAQVEHRIHALLAFGGATSTFLANVERLLGTASLSVHDSLQGEPIAIHLLRRALHRNRHLFTPSADISAGTRHHVRAALTVWKRDLKHDREPALRTLGWGLLGLLRDSLAIQSPHAYKLNATASKAAQATLIAFDDVLARHYPATVAGQQQAWADKLWAAHHDAQRVPVYASETFGGYAKQLGMALHQGLWRAAADPHQVAVLWQAGDTGRRNLWELLDLLSTAHEDPRWQSHAPAGAPAPPAVGSASYGPAPWQRWPMPADGIQQIDPVLDQGAANSVAHLAGVSRLDIAQIAQLPWEEGRPIHPAVQARLAARPAAEQAAVRLARVHAAPGVTTTRRRLRS